MKILLTGSTGFIGKNIKEAWSGRYELRTPLHEELDLLDSETVEQYLRKEHFDVILHTANTNDVVHPEQIPHILEYNMRMFCNLERCQGLYGKLYYFGSGAEYDMRHYIPQMPESYFGTHVPQDPYGFSKYIMSKMTTGNIYDLRLFGVFGKYEEWQRRFISNMIYRNLTGQVMEMNQNMFFDYLYIDDLISILEWFVNHEPSHHHYNVCSGKHFELLTLARMVIEETGISNEIVIKSDQWKTTYSGDNRRLLAETGDISFTDMRIAIKRLISYYKKCGFSGALVR